MRQLFSVLILFLTTTFSFAQNSPVSWTWNSKSLGNDQYELTFTAKVQDGWWVYTQQIDPNADMAPVPTSINFETKGIEATEFAEERTSNPDDVKEKADPLFENTVVKKYKHELILKHVVTAKGLTEIKGYLNYMTCNDEQCMPPTDVDFSFALGAEAAATPVATSDIVLKGQDADYPVLWDVSYKAINDSTYDVTFDAKIKDGWWTYSQNVEDGPVPTELNFEGDNFRLESVKATETTSDPKNIKEGADPLFDNAQVKKYKHDAKFVHRVILKGGSKELKGYFTFMTCDDEKCMPPRDIDFTINLGGKTATVTKTEEPKEGERRDFVIPSLKETAAAPLGNCDGGLTIDVDKNKNKEESSLVMIFVFGFIGGLFALLTPCVFPMIPLTVSFFTKQSKSKAAGIRNASIYGASIIGIYTILGYLVTVSFGADTLNWFSTWWVSNLLFFLLFFVFAFSFFGYYEITLPSSWTNKADNASNKGGLIGIFFMAFTLSLVSFSCTGPIIGSLLVQAATSGAVIGPVMGMLGFSVALALPFTLFAAFPGWLNSLPRSGGWMTNVKVFLGFIEIAFAFKFFSTADLTIHMGIFPYEAFIGTWVITFGLLSLYLFGFIHFPHDNPNAKIGVKRKVLATVMTALTIYIASGFMVNAKTGLFHTPSLLSGYAPSAGYSYILPAHCPPGIKNCFHDYEEGVAEAKRLNKPVLIDFTGYGCVNCRKVEDNVWSDETINKLLNDEFVLISLYVDDNKKLAQVQYDKAGNKLRTVGSVKAAFQRENFGVLSQPYYVLMTPDEKVINQPIVYENGDIETHTKFYECGLKIWKELK